MKANLMKQFYALLLFSMSGYGQSTFIFDQQSVTNDAQSAGSGGGIQSSQPVGQSFIPSFSSVRFIRPLLYDGTQNNNLGATVYVNLRSDSITGPILGSTDPVPFPDNFGRGSNGVANFFFPAAVAVTPGTTYYFQPVVQSGDAWGIGAYNNFNYPNGTLFFQGVPNPGSDLWFREGIVPEPSSIALLSMGIGIFACLRQFRKRATASTKF